MDFVQTFEESYLCDVENTRSGAGGRRQEGQEAGGAGGRRGRRGKILGGFTDDIEVPDEFLLLSRYISSVS